jgi:uroporphyrinogen decarboxylase
MNGFQRISAALRGEPQDRIPVMLHNFMLAAREAGMSMKEYRSNPANIAEAHIQAVEKYGLDGILLDVDTALLADALHVPVEFPEDEPARAFGALLQSPEEFDRLEPVDITRNERIMCSVEAARMMKDHFKDDIYLRGNVDQAPFSLASMIRTPAEWMLDLLIHEDFAFRLLDYCLIACEQYIRLMAAAGVHMISGGDSPAGPDMISPELYRKFALPYEKKLAGLVHEHRKPYLLHICGNTDLILEDMKNAGFDAVELDYKTDIHKIFHCFSDQVTFFGNIDPSGVIARGTPDLVTRRVNELLSVYSGSHRFVLNAGCAIPPGTPEANIRSLVRTASEWPCT